MKTSLIFLLGIGMGTVLGILVAPEAGKITRKKIRDEADKLIDQAMQKKRDVLEAGRQVSAELKRDAPAVMSESRFTN